jgi:hypothetical protein
MSRQIIDRYQKIKTQKHKNTKTQIGGANILLSDDNTWEFIRHFVDGLKTHNVR